MFYQKIIYLIFFACILPIGQASNNLLDDESVQIYKHKESSKMFIDDILDKKLTKKKRKQVNTVRILSVDGCAMRGIIPATILKIIEEQTKQPISKLFHIVGGSSFGCMLTSGLTIPSDDNPLAPKWSANDLINQFKDQSHKIFKRYIPFLPFCNSDSLESATIECCGNTTFDQSITPTLGVTFDCIKSETKSICSWEEEEIFRTQDVMLASSANPIVFGPRFLNPINQEAANHCYMASNNSLDSNDQLMILIAKARKLYPKAKRFEIVSLGSGVVHTQIFRDLFQSVLNFSNYFLRIFNLGLNTIPLVSESQIGSIIFGYYTRIDPTIPGQCSQLDPSSKNIEMLEKAIFEHLKIKENNQQFSDLLKRLSAEKD